MKFYSMLLISMFLTSSVFAEEWKAVGGINGIRNTGNSEDLTVGGNMLVSMKEGMNQVTWRGIGAYGQSTDDVTGVTSTDTENWLSELRYDRFLTEIFSLYGLGHMNHDEPAGYDLNYGFSAGFAHFLKKSEKISFKYELGFDFTREKYVTNVSNNLYSGRVYLQYTHKISESAYFSQDMENLMDVNDTEDYRINAMTALNLKMTGKVAFQVGYVIRFDNQPVPTFKKTDTTTQIGLNVNFL